MGLVTAIANSEQKSAITLSATRPHPSIHSNVA